MSAVGISCRPQPSPEPALSPCLDIDDLFSHFFSQFSLPFSLFYEQNFLFRPVSKTPRGVSVIPEPVNFKPLPLSIFENSYWNERNKWNFRSIDGIFFSAQFPLEKIRKISVQKGETLDKWHRISQRKIIRRISSNDGLNHRSLKAKQNCFLIIAA